MKLGKVKLGKVKLGKVRISLLERILCDMFMCLFLKASVVFKAKRFVSKQFFKSKLVRGFARIWIFISELDVIPHAFRYQRSIRSMAIRHYSTIQFFVCICEWVGVNVCEFFTHK